MLGDVAPSEGLLLLAVVVAELLEDGALARVAPSEDALVAPSEDAQLLEVESLVFAVLLVAQEHG